MLLRDLREFEDIELSIEINLEFLLKKVLTEGKRDRYRFWNPKCYAFFTESRVILIKATRGNMQTYCVESIPYYSIQRYLILYNKAPYGAIVKLYISGHPAIRFCLLMREKAFGIIDLVAKYNMQKV